MTDTRFIQKLRIRNLLSFGPESEEIELGPLNVLIGPNGSGKSNLIEALSLLRAAPRDLAEPIRRGGGIAEWLWKGEAHSRMRSAEVTATVSYREAARPLQYVLCFSETGHRTHIDREVILSAGSDAPETAVPIYRREDGQHRAPGNSGDSSTEDLVGPHLHPGQGVPVEGLEIGASQSVLSYLRDPVQYAELTYLADRFGHIAIYRDWDTGTGGTLRKPQQADLPPDLLLDDASNLGLVLNDLVGRLGGRDEILEHLRRFHPDLEDAGISIFGNTVQVYVRERGLTAPTPASRLSDGTLRYLCLLAVLCHPEPPPLVCIEEPELGLHPDMLNDVAKLLSAASQRTQLVVTTHSDLLVSALTETPEAVIVCERDQDGSRFERLEPEKLTTWLEKYELGEVWLAGELGGTRW